MGNKKFLFISLLILAVGFASVTTTLYITSSIGVATKKSDFDVYFSGAEIDDMDVSNEVIKDKKHIVYTSNELKAKDDTSVLKYEVTNDSTEYDATVTISCTPMKTDYIEVTLTPVTFDIEAGKIKTGEIEVKLTNVSEVEQNVSIACELEVKGVEKEALITIGEKNNNYGISGVLKDSEGNPLSVVKLAAFSEKKIITTDRFGYFYMTGLERGVHHLYYIEDEEEYSGSEEDYKDDELAIVSTNGVLKVTNKNYKIEDLKYGKDLEDEGIYCDLELGFAKGFDYVKTGNVKEQNWDIPCDGIYKLEVWGASGATYRYDNYGYGGYSVGEMNLKEGTKLYINAIGETGITSTSGSTGTTSGGYNGGADSTVGSNCANSARCSGGGATHIATVSGELKTLSAYKDTNNKFASEGYYSSNEILIVAGGGGSTCAQTATYITHSYTGVSAGGGATSTDVSSGCSWCGAGMEPSAAATQTTGYAFGLGSSGNTCAGAGGGGFFGGNAQGYTGSGGSGYVANPNLKNKYMVCYGCPESDDENAPTTSVTTVSTKHESDQPQSGNGYARIELVRYR